jgi:5-formyltetrahydrofolate cyclo-ligase
VAAASKTELRAELGAARLARSAAAIDAARAAVRTIVLERCVRDRPTCVAAYVPMRTEPGSTQLLDELAALGVRVLVPVLLANHDLDWAPWLGLDDPATSRRSAGRGLAGATATGTPVGVDAIATADLVLVPALAVALDGTRLGRGGGSYDRALCRVHTGISIAALLFDGELRHCLPRQSWDRPVTAAVLPSGWRDLSSD